MHKVTIEMTDYAYEFWQRMAGFSGQTIDDYLHDLLVKPPPKPLSPEEKAELAERQRQYDEWVAARPRSPGGHDFDDSRESIY